MYQKATFPTSTEFQSKALQWGNRFKHCSLFNPNATKKYPFEPFRHFLAVGNSQAIASKGNPFHQLEKLITTTDKWLVGHLCYDLKNDLEHLTSNHKAIVDFPLMAFFEAENLIFFENDQIHIHSISDPQKIYQSIISETEHATVKLQVGQAVLKTSRSTYINNVKKIIDHIEEGDMYEINYCIEYIMEKLSIDPVVFYNNLCRLSPTPFSNFYKCNDLYVLGASPERFLKKTGNQIISQPIKGTARRGQSAEEDATIIHALRNDEKEQAENMMIVDLVRNDLARSAISGTVNVEEMFGIYSFRHWHQMISTVSAQIRPEIKITNILKHAFPVGSMTGAPKIKVMELIEKYETFKRGLYAGTIGYITPDKDFDFNVVIRSLFYDQARHKGAFMVGSAITYDAIPEREYDECLLKAHTILETLKTLQ